MLIPIFVLLGHAVLADFSHWQHLFSYVLPQAIVNTGILLFGVGVCVAIIGTASAWFVAAYQFPGRAYFSWALLLPLAVPAYIVAFAWIDVLHPINPLQTAIRALLGFDSPRQFRLPDLRNLGGAIMLLSSVLYPYVYASVRAMFSTQSANLIEAARNLGASSWEVFFKVALPLARPALAAGLTLALLETLNDIGASEFLGISTLTVAIYTTWLSRSNLGGAAQIASAMLFFVFALIFFESYLRRKSRYYALQKMRPLKAQQLSGIKAWSATFICAIPILIGFVIPFLHLTFETYKRLVLTGAISAQLKEGLFNTLLLATSVSALTLFFGLIVAWSARTSNQEKLPRFSRFYPRLASLGYAIPGTVLAIGLLTPFAFLNNLLAKLPVNLFFGLSLGEKPLLILGSVAALIIACILRFLIIPIGGIEAGLARIPNSFLQAARTLGESTYGALWRVHLPLLKPALAASFLLVFVDVMKELPVTLLLRPLSFETLATQLYAEAARGSYEEGAIAALIIVLVGLLPVILLAKMQKFSKKKQA